MTRHDPAISQIVVEVNYECNHRCIFCYNCWKNDYVKEHVMTASEFEKVLEKAPDAERYAISGGEPLLRDDIFELLEITKNHSDQIALLTNGVLINDEKARKFSKLGIRVQVPFHGLEKTHDQLVGMKGAYKRAIKGIAYLKKHGVDFAVTSVANRKNIDELERIFELGVALGSKELQVIRFMPGGEGMVHRDLELDDKGYIKMLKALNNVGRKYGVFAAIGAPNLPCRFPEENYRHIHFGKCSAGIDWFAIDPSGRVRMCNHSPTIIGNLLQQDFKEIWNHPVFRDFREGKMVPDECRGCKDLERCLGGCRAVAETCFGDLRAPDPLYHSRS